MSFPSKRTDHSLNNDMSDAVKTWDTIMMPWKEGILATSGMKYYTVGNHQNLSLHAMQALMKIHF